MPLDRRDLPAAVLDILRRGAVIPAHPLALDANRRLDARRQRALSRYYLDAGAGGLAIGVHTTQFAIRAAGLYEPLLASAAASVASWAQRPVVMIAGVCGSTEEAVREARIAVAHGYHGALLSLAAMKGADDRALVEHCAAVATEMPLVGFYLQRAVGGIELGVDFWTRFAALDNVIAIKVAPFDRYRTLAAIRGVVEAGAEERIVLLTGNDDHIVLDLITPFTIMREGKPVTMRFRGGLLGHWSVWVKSAVELWRRCDQAVHAGKIDADLLALAARVTDCNGAFFDAANDFRGAIAGCHEVLRRQGLLAGIWCLDPAETLSSGQSEEIERVYAMHRDLCDDEFVAANLARWLD
jgi:hypothetical protein